ncbi:MAG TPA: hypothetical protein VH640_11240 [Bryobacteraceae bacterium]|jgi:hypothetical protein
MRFLATSAVVFFLAGPLAFAQGTWTLARSSRFEVYSQAGGDNARQVLWWFERLHAFFARQTGLTVNGRSPLRVLVFRSAAEYEPYRLRPTADAFYTATESRDYIVLSSPEAGRLAAHEYWHFVEHASALQLPPWLNEGMAEFFSTVRLGEVSGRMGARPAGHTRILRIRAWIPLATLVALPADAPLRSERDSAEVFYAESWAMAHMLMLAPHYAPRLHLFLDRITSGNPSAQALVEVYGKPLDTIARDLRGWIEKGRYAPVWVSTEEETDAPVEVSQVSSYSVRLLFADVLTSEEKPDRAENLYRELASEAPEDPAVPAALAMLALRRHDVAEARREWQSALERGIRDPQICYRFAKQGEDAGLSPPEVRSALERAVALQPDFDDALFSLALADSQAGDPQAAVDHLRAMHTIAPARRFTYWTELSDAANLLGLRTEAKAAADSALAAAANTEQREQAERLALMAETDLAVRFSRDASGHTHLETVRAPHTASPDASTWNPFIEPGDRVRRAEGHLREVECGQAGTAFVVETPSGVVRLAVPDLTHVEMRNGPAEFTCGPQTDDKVVAVWAETGASTGVLRGLEFR